MKKGHGRTQGVQYPFLVVLFFLPSPRRSEGL
jgi:hypothetical protein